MQNFTDPPELESKLLVVAPLSRDLILIGWRFGWQAPRITASDTGSKWVGETDWRLGCIGQRLERKFFDFFWKSSNYLNRLQMILNICEIEHCYLVPIGDDAGRHLAVEV